MTRLPASVAVRLVSKAAGHDAASAVLIEGCPGLLSFLELLPFFVDEDNSAVHLTASYMYPNPQT